MTNKEFRCDVKTKEKGRHARGKTTESWILLSHEIVMLHDILVQSKREIIGFG